MYMPRWRRERLPNLPPWPRNHEAPSIRLTFYLYLTYLSCVSSILLRRKSLYLPRASPAHVVSPAFPCGFRVCIDSRYVTHAQRGFVTHRSISSPLLSPAWRCLSPDTPVRGTISHTAYSREHGIDTESWAGRAKPSSGSSSSCTLSWLGSLYTWDRARSSRGCEMLHIVLVRIWF